MRRAYLPVLFTAAILRGIAVIERGPFIYVDSIDYETLDFTGRARRPWATPLLYWLVQENQARVLAQGVIGALCWSALAVEVTKHVQDRRVQWGLLLGVLGFSLTTVITSWDTTMLSEPLALSLTALLLALLLRFGRDPSRRSACFVLAAFVPWVFTRQNNLVIGLLVAGTVVVAGLVLWRVQRALPKVVLALGAALVLVSGLAAASYARNTEIVHHNLASVLGNRLLLDPDDAAWFVAHGMPADVVEEQTFPAAADELLADDAFRDWVETEGLGTYARFLLLHPIDTISRPLEAIVSERPPTYDPDRPDESMLVGITYGAAREVLPAPFEELVVDQRTTGSVVFVLVGTVVATWLALERRGRWAGAWTVPVLAVALQWPALTVVWHGTSAEFERLGLVSLVAIWTGLLVQIALLVDAAITRRAEADPAP